MHGFHHPNGPAVVHQVLVKQPAVEFGERLARLGHDDAVKAVQPAHLHRERGLPGRAVDGEFAQVKAEHVVALAQVEFERRRLNCGQFAVTFNEGDALALGLKKSAQRGREGVLQVLNARVDLCLGSLGKLLEQERYRPLAFVVANHRAGEYLLGFHPVGFLNF